MLELLSILNLLISLSCTVLAIYGAWSFKKYFGLVGPFWALAIPVTDKMSVMFDAFIQRTSGSWNDFSTTSSAKIESFWGASSSDVYIWTMAIQATFEYATYLLIILVILSDLARLLELKDITKPKFLPLWSNKVTHIVGALAVFFYLVSEWIMVSVYLLPNAA